MTWDLGIGGLGLLAIMAVTFGLLAQLVAGRRTTRWMGAIAAAVFFIAGVITSEAWFGWATEEDLQPNIDGLSFDEVLLFSSLAGIAAVIVVRFVTKRSQHRTPV